MSHPAPHPGTPTPPPGPSRRETAFLDAFVAGSYGRHAEPLTSSARTFIYRAQIGRHRLTPRQRRRRDHKENRAYREFLAA